VPACAAIDVDGDVSCQHDEEAGHRLAFRAQHLSLVELAKGPVRAQPRELLARRSAESLVPREALDEICRHVIAPDEESEPEMLHQRERWAMTRDGLPRPGIDVGRVDPENACPILRSFVDVSS
jgi:hypothetical protein